MVQERRQEDRISPLSLPPIQPSNPLPPPVLPSAPAGCNGGVAAFVGELGLFTVANFENVPRHY